MPPYANLAQFQQRIRQANNQFNAQRSPLGPVIAALQAPNPDKAAIQRLVNALPQDVRNTYSDALGFLDGDYLNPRRGGAQAQPQQIRVLPAGPVAPRNLNLVTQQQRALPNAAPGVPGGILHDTNGPFHGWTEIDNLNRLPPGWNRPQTSAFTNLQVVHITQILRTVQQTVTLAINNLRSTNPLGGNGLPPPPIPPRAGLPPPVQPVVDAKAALFIRFFGPCTAPRIQTVLNNYSTMALQLFGARGQNVTGLAVMNEAPGNQNMAETWRRSIFRPASGHIALIAGSGFFRTAIGNTFNANDATIGTLVHEFAHACCDASDVPRAAQLQAGNALDAAGMPANGVVTCIIAEHDEQLVAWLYNRPWPGGGVRPAAPSAPQLLQYADYPLVNADSYGQYALALLVGHLQQQAQQGVGRLT